MARGDSQALGELSLETLNDHGNATWGFMNFILALGLVNDRQPDVAAAEDPGWRRGRTLLHLGHAGGRAVSRYAANQTLREMLISPGALEAFQADPLAFLADRDLSLEERQALAGRDYPALYRLGVHHFTLFQWARRLQHHEGVDNWMPGYFAALAGLGHPDIAT